MLSPLGDDRVHPSADHARRRAAPLTDEQYEQAVNTLATLIVR
jgi:hypothetical protein